MLGVRGQQFTPPQFIAAAQVFGELFQHDKREMHVRAGQAALHFARYAAGVNMVVREDSLSLYMSEYLIERIRAEPKVKVLLNTEVTALHGDPVLGSDLLKGDKPPESGVRPQTLRDGNEPAGGLRGGRCQGRFDRALRFGGRRGRVDHSLRPSIRGGRVIGRRGGRR